jgi:hypothetical protein
MRSIPYSDIEKGVAAIAGIDPTSLLAHEKVLLAEYISDATKYCWDYYPWSEFTKTEKRYFRDSFVPSTSYKAGDEVFHNGKYYRARVDNADAVIDISIVNWYEVGDVIGAPEWSAKGLYYKGAKVQLDGVMYICIDQPISNIESHGEDPCSFDLNGIHITDTNYFEEIYNIFDRYIAYEQVGKDAIGTCLAITLEDPRYNDTKPLNWREDREGIYIFPNELSFNEVWVRYRLQAPVFTSQSADEDIPRFLAQAIKTFAYKHWLIGDGQHEKAVQQDMYGMDLLVRELDKMDSHQERGQPYVIIKNPYRRLNAKQGYVAPITEDQIGNLVEGTTNITIEVGKVADAFNAVKRGYASSMAIEVSTEVFGKNALKESTAEISTEIKLGKSMGLNVAVDAYPDEIGTRVKLGTPIAGRTKIIGYNAVKKTNLKASQGRITCNTFTKGYKLNAVLWSGWNFPPPIIVIECENVIAEKISPETSQVVASFSVDGTFAGRNAVVESQVTIGLAKSVICNGKTAIQEGSASIASEVFCSVFGRSSVVNASASSAIVVSSTSTGSNVVVRSEVTPMPIAMQTSVNGRSSVVYGNASGLINLLVTTSVQGFEAVVIGFANSSIAVGLQASGYNSLTAGEASVALSIGLENVDRRRETNGSVVDMDIEMFLGKPADVQLFNADYINKSTNWRGGITSDTGQGLDRDDMYLSVGSSYYAPVQELYASDDFTPVLTQDLSKYNFGSYGDGYTFEYLMADPDVLTGNRVNNAIDYPLQDNTILIKKTPLTLLRWSQDPNDAPVQGYLIGFPNSFIHPTTGNFTTFNTGVHLDRDTKAYPNTEDYSVSFYWAVVAPYEGYINHPQQGTLRTTNFNAFIYDYIYNSNNQGGGVSMSTATSYRFGSYGTKRNNYEGWNDPATSLNSYHNLRNALWSRTNPWYYVRKFVYDENVHPEQYQADGTYLFESLDRVHGGTQVIKAGDHPCEYDNYTYGFHKDNDILYHNMYDSADPWDLTVAWDGNNRLHYGLSETSIENTKTLFRVIPKKLKDRFPIQFQDWVSDELYRGAPKFVEAVKHVEPSYPNAYSITSGQNSYAVIPQGTLDFGSSNFTISFWCRPTNLPSTMAAYKKIFYTRSLLNSTTRNLEISIGTDTAGVVVQQTASGSTTQSSNMFFFDGSTIMQNDAWHHVLIVKSGAGSNDSSIYIDGTQIETGQIADLGLDNGDAWLGTTGQSGTDYEGQVDEFAVWKKALSLSEIATVYNNGKPNDLSSLNPNDWWRMGDSDSGVGTTVTNEISSRPAVTLATGTTFSSVTP